MSLGKKSLRAVKKRAKAKTFSDIEKRIRELGFFRIAGVDEVGRGPLAGPVVAAACILPEKFRLAGIDDSKKLTFDERFALYQKLVSYPGLDFGIGVVEAKEIDELNIHHASLEAMRRAVFRLKEAPQFLLIDGRHTLDCEIPSEAVVGGDEKILSIGAASIFAKVTRDQIMKGYDDLYPGYGFGEHMGYGTKKHLAGIDEYGPTPIHRMSFGRLKDEKHDGIRKGATSGLDS